MNMGMQCTTFFATFLILAFDELFANGLIELCHHQLQAPPLIRDKQPRINSDSEIRDALKLTTEIFVLLDTIIDVYSEAVKKERTKSMPALEQRPELWELMKSIETECDVMLHLLHWGRVNSAFSHQKAALFAAVLITKFLSYYNAVQFSMIKRFTPDGHMQFLPGDLKEKAFLATYLIDYANRINTDTLIDAEGTFTTIKGLMNTVQEKINTPENTEILRQRTLNPAINPFVEIDVDMTPLNELLYIFANMMYKHKTHQKNEAWVLGLRNSAYDIMLSIPDSLTSLIRNFPIAEVIPSILMTIEQYLAIEFGLSDGSDRQQHVPKGNGILTTLTLDLIVVKDIEDRTYSTRVIIKPAPSIYRIPIY